MVLSMLKHFLQFARMAFDKAAQATSLNESSKSLSGDKGQTIWFGCYKLGAGCRGLSYQCEQFVACLPLLKKLHRLGNSLFCNNTVMPTHQVAHEDFKSNEKLLTYALTRLKINFSAWLKEII